MTSKKNLVEKIKEQLASLLVGEKHFAQIQVGEMTVTTKDEEFTVGSEVYTIDKDGNNVPLADGEYVADDGTKMVVVAGKLTEIMKEEQKPEGESPEVEVSVENEACPTCGKDENKGVEMGSMEKRMEKLEMAITEMMKKMEDYGKKEVAMMEKFSKLSELPSTEKITTGNVEFKSIENKKEGIGSIDILAMRERIRKNR